MNKKRLIVLTIMIIITGSMNVYAGEWKQDNIGWWYQNNDGSYFTDSWQWIDGNNDGIAESYYFGSNGYLLVNTITPDGFQVNENGAWIVNGIVQIEKNETKVAETDTKNFSIDASKINIKMKIPHSGTNNNYVELEIINQTGYTIKINGTSFNNGYTCTWNCEKGFETYELKSGYYVKLPYYRSVLWNERYNSRYNDMYLDNNSTGWVRIQLNGKYYTVYYDKDGTTEIIPDKYR